MTTREAGPAVGGSEPSASGADVATANTNVGRPERAASAVVGGALVLRGLQRGSFGGVATALAGGALAARGLTGHSRLYRVLDVNTAPDRERLDAGGAARPRAVRRSVTVVGSADDLGEYWRDPDRLTRIVGELADVSAASDDRLRWRVRAPLGRTLEWETRISEDEPGERLRWETVEGAPIPHRCTVRFRPAPAGRGTEVALRTEYDPPGGSLGAAAMDRLGFAPRLLAGAALRRFKSLVETGEVPTLEGNPSARGRGDLL